MEGDPGRLPLEDFLRVVALAPLVSMDLIVRNPRGEVLLGWRTNRPARDTWFVPGGVVRRHERREEAFLRLTRLELGVEVPLAHARLLGVYDHIYPDNAGEGAFGTHYVVQGMALELDLDLAGLPPAQHRAYRWWALAELLADPSVHANTKAYFPGA